MDVYCLLLKYSPCIVHIHAKRYQYYIFVVQDDLKNHSKSQRFLFISNIEILYSTYFLRNIILLSMTNGGTIGNFIFFRFHIVHNIVYSRIIFDTKIVKCINV